MVTESKVVFTKAEKRRKWKLIVIRYGVSFWSDENILKVESGNRCTTLRV
jgi:hypothetical protein